MTRDEAARSVYLGQVREAFQVTHPSLPSDPAAPATLNERAGEFSHGSSAQLDRQMGRALIERTVRGVEAVLRDHCAGCGAEFNAEIFGMSPSCCS